METLDRFETPFSWETLLPAGGTDCGRAYGLSPGWKEAAREAWNVGKKIFRGTAFLETWDLYGWGEERESVILRREDDCGETARNETLFIGPGARHLSGSRNIVTVLCTAGGALEERAQEAASRGNPLLQYYLNVFGVKALEHIRLSVQEILASRARASGWGVTPSLAPGSLQGWPLEGQKDLFRLTGGEAGGMSINDASFLTPALSMSFLVGMGPGCASTCVRSLCPDCPRYESCGWRRENNPL
jgi:hypothetical protein